MTAFQAVQLWSLPGESAVVLATAIFSNAAAVGTIVSMFASGSLSAADATILMPGLYLMGALLQFTARVLETAQVPRKLWPLMFVICLINSGAAMWVMALLVKLRTRSAAKSYVHKPSSSFFINRSLLRRQLKKRGERLSGTHFIIETICDPTKHPTPQ